MVAIIKKIKLQYFVNLNATPKIVCSILVGRS